MTGYFIYKNKIVQQHDNVESVIRELFIETQPARVLEIGTSYGGLSLLIRDTLNDIGMEDVPFKTYDVMLKFEEGGLDNIKNLEFNLYDIFSSEQHGFVYQLDCEDTKQFIQAPGRTIIFVDGGNKKAEFNCLAKHIKPGDIILAHDYCENTNAFEEQIKDKIWNWCEITDEDIKDSCEQFNLVPYFHEQMKNVVWACRLKQ